jgi:hypothetical protein
MPTSKSPKKIVAKKTVKVAGQKHVVEKKANGEIDVAHPNGGKTYNLSKLAGAKTIKQGTASVKKWHSTHPKKGGK